MKLEQKAKDQVTGFEGIIRALADHLTGERRALVSSQALHDGFMPASRWFDVRRLLIIGTDVLILKPSGPVKPIKRKKA